MVSALAVAFVLHAGLATYLWRAQFESHFREYTAAVTEVELVRPTPPPPPPPPPKAEAPPPKPRAVTTAQPRPPRTISLPTIPPLPVPPVVNRVEVREPPVLAPEPLPIPKPVVAASKAPPVIRNPDWLQRPSAAEIARYYPDRAARLGVEGRAVISCQVSAAGRLEACAVAQETPDDQGFGAAAMRMSRHFRLKPMTQDGVPVSGGTISIPIVFNIEA